MAQPKKKISATRLVTDIRGGASDLELLAKYELSPKSLKGAFAKLVKAGLIEQWEIDEREQAAHAPVPVSWTCPACGTLHDRQYEECPHCGVVAAKYVPKDEDQGPASPYAQPAPRRGSPEEGAIFGGSSGVKVQPRQRTIAIVVITLLGAALVAFGTSLPVLKLPVLGGTSLLQLGKFSQQAELLGYLLVAVSAAAILLALFKMYRGLWVAGLGSLGLLGYALWDLSRNVAKAQQAVTKLGAAVDQTTASRTDAQAHAEALKGLAGQVQEMFKVELSWGWIVLFLGAILIIAAAFTGTRRSYE
jgi:hypothetical protein